MTMFLTLGANLYISYQIKILNLQRHITDTVAVTNLVSRSLTNKKMMKKTIIAVSAIFIATASAQEEWVKNIGKKPGNGPINDNALGKISSKLDFIPYKSTIAGKPSLAVRVRNGKHKMGGSTIGIKLKDFPTTMKMGRIDIHKPMSVITSQPDGSHLFETFTEGSKTYEIYYTVTGGKLSPKVTVKAK